MKKVIFLLVAFPLFANARKPEKILPKTLEIRTTSWYAEQEKAWSEELSINSKNKPDAWFNYFASAVYAQESKETLNSIVGKMNQAVPGSYESLVVKVWKDGFNEQSYDLLQKAYAMQPDKTEAYNLLQAFAEIKLDKPGRASFSKQLYNSSQISSSLLNYSYNVLMSLEPSAIIITEGESATAPLYVLQDVLNVRSDVTILNLDWLTNSDYRSRKFSETGLAPWQREVSNLDELRKTISAELPQKNTSRKFYYALTLAKENVSEIKQSLYVVGLASLHSLANFDNVAVIKHNLEKEFLMDYLLVDFNGSSKSDAGKVFSSNYLLSMILLYETYQKEGSLEKARKLRSLMERIAADSDKKEIIDHYLNGATGEAIPYFPFAINVKFLEGNFRQVSNNLYAYNTELTNLLYNQFLQYLQANNLADLYEKYKFDYTGYDEPALSLMKNYSTDRGSSKKNKGYTNYPAVNVSYEAALAYCAWLTDQYNKSAEHKFKKVKFRLPSIDEWQIAAASIKNPTSWILNDQQAEVRLTPKGKEFDKKAELKKVSMNDPEILYPWFRFFGLKNSPVNTKGCYLGNFKVMEKSVCPGLHKDGIPNGDGFATMGEVGSYFPNAIGLFDVVGNVAEMTAEKGKACGGSWNHPAQESTIRSINTYAKPDAAVGFRVFMEIIEK